MKVKPVKDLAITGSFVKSDADVNKPYNNWAQKGHANRDLAVKIEYKGTDINKPGSYGLYAKWVEPTPVALSVGSVDVTRLNTNTPDIIVKSGLEAVIILATF